MIDLAAPQLIIPESLTDSSKAVVVVDLGHLSLDNRSAGVVDSRTRNDTEDDDGELLQ